MSPPQVDQKVNLFVMKKKLLLCYLPLFLFITNPLTAQNIIPNLEFTVQHMGTEELNWGVYVRPLHGFDTIVNPIIATGQVTLLLKNNAQDDIEHIQSINGNWNGSIEKIVGPMEAPDLNYYFIGLIDAGDGIPLENGKETLLLTLRLNNCPDTIALIDNQQDPFNILPNSENSNPGMDLEVYDIENSTIYNWANNYHSVAFQCGNQTTATNEATTLGLLTMYPNPADQLLHLNWKGKKAASFSIVDLRNQVVQASQTLPSAASINIESLQAGMYFVKIQSNNQQYYTKFIKN